LLFLALFSGIAPAEKQEIRPKLLAMVDEPDRVVRSYLSLPSTSVADPIFLSSSPTARQKRRSLHR
jgi:hypothetical protein